MSFMYTQNKSKVIYGMSDTHRETLRKHVFHFSIKTRKGLASHSDCLYWQ